MHGNCQTLPAHQAGRGDGFASYANMATGESSSTRSTSWQCQRSQLLSTSKRFAKRKVYVRLNIFTVSNVDTVSGSFTAEGYVYAFWEWLGNDASFKAMCQLDAAEREQAITRDFDPEIMFLNSVGLVAMQENRFTSCTPGSAYSQIFESQRVVMQTFKCVATFRESYELQTFPFDTQPLNIVVTSKKTVKDIEFDVSSHALSIMQRQHIVLPEFQITGLEWLAYDTERTRFVQNQQRKNYPLLYIAVISRRNTHFYIWNVVAPMFVLVGMGASSFAIPRDIVAERLSVTLTLVLTTFTFKTSISQWLPRISYNTIMDWYILGGFLLLTLVVVGISISGYYATTDDGHLDDDFARRVDRCMRWTFAVLFALWNLTLVAAGIYVRRFVNGAHAGPAYAIVSRNAACDRDYQLDDGRADEQVAISNGRASSKDQFNGLSKKFKKTKSELQLRVAPTGVSNLTQPRWQRTQAQVRFVRYLAASRKSASVGTTSTDEGSHG